MGKVLYCLILIFCFVIAIPKPADAHVLITDNTGTIGAILHITPDDDPIAGQPSSLYFDIQNKSFSKHSHKLELSITNDEGQVTQVPVFVAGSSVSASYTFPQQGVYKIILTANAQNVASAHAHTFTHSQRISRGTIGSALDKPTHQWANLLLVVSLCSVLVLAIFAYNRRKEIAAYSKW